MNKKFLKGLQASLLTSVMAVGLGLSLPMPSNAQPAPAKGEVKITGFTHGGRGCPQGSVGYIISDDLKTIELLFDKFIVELDRKRTEFPRTSNCGVSFKMTYPRGWTASWHRVEHRGFADLSQLKRGGKGQLRARYYIPGAGGFDARRLYTFPKKVLDYTIVHEDINTKYAPCGEVGVPMTVDTRLRIDGPVKGYNTVTVDSISKKVKTILNLKWKRCPR
ncbi:MAG: DUF4360 domain-containing protein [Calothrix sp. MO_167.B12]|nr:DUF4360 domain-containing protein [Calothrix sp. MO_167.B12]